MTRSREATRFWVTFALLVVAGIAALAYVLVHERLALPFSNTYNVKAEFTAADGVVPGLGQPVNVAGVNVGSIVGATHASDGNALITMRLDRNQLPHVYASATAALAPITPLGDVELDLDPGSPPARILAPGATIPVGASSVPLSLNDLLSALDSDTRGFLTSLLASLAQGTRGRGLDIRRLLLTLGPTTAQVGEITRALAQRRAALADLVHNLALVTRAASRDDQLASVVAAGNQTLSAVAAQQTSLGQAIRELPGTLSDTSATLGNVTSFANRLGPTVSALLPAVNRLPATLGSIDKFARVGTSVLSRQVRPLVRRAQPLVRDLGTASGGLRDVAPSMTSVFQVLTYLVNELAYNPNNRVNGYPNYGFLFWLAWADNFLARENTIADAHGTLLRAAVVMDCSSLNAISDPALTTIIQLAFGVSNLCPAGS